MKALKLAILLLFVGSISAQKYGEGLSGDFSIYYTDTIIFNPELKYNEYGYEGDYPLFVQIWHPTPKSIDSESLTLREMHHQDLPEELKSVYSHILFDANNSFIDYNIKESFPDYKTLFYEEYSYMQVLEMLYSGSTQSKRGNGKEMIGYPTIVYHHGSQGRSDENHIMAEYFASRGFIFISSNFHLSYESQPFGLTEGIQKNTSNAERAIEFAHQMAGDNPVYYIGHSWGAQVGWRCLYKKGLADAFVSMETTIEFQPPIDSLIQDKWEEVYRVVKVEEQQFDLPILMFANTQKEGTFNFFTNCNSKESIHISAKEEFGHESYTSAFHLRQFLNDEIPQQDSLAMREQYKLYIEHLGIIEEFLNATKDNRSIDLSSFEENFYIAKED